MLKPGDIHPLHRGRPYIPERHIARSMGDAGAAYSHRVLGSPETVFIRNRLSGPAHHEVIGFHPRVPLWEWLVCMAVAAAVGAMMVSM